MKQDTQKITVRLFRLPALVLTTFGFVGLAWSQRTSDLATIGNNTPLSLQSAQFLGHADPNTNMDIVIGLKMRNEDELSDLIARQNDPNSPDFHNYITPSEFVARFGPEQSDVDRVTAYLQSQGLTGLQVSPNSMLIQARGAVHQIEKAAHVSINIYSLKGSEHFSNDRDPSFPGYLQHIVQSVMGLTSISNIRSMAHANVQPQAPSVVYTPANIATAYNFPNANNTRIGSGKTYSGKGVKLAIATAFVYDPVDVNTFWQQFHITRTGTIRNIPVVASTTVLHYETTLDVEQAGAQAPGADLLIYSVPADTYQDFALMFNQIVHENLADVISTSWVDCESVTPSAALQSEHAAILQGTAQGQSFFVGSGDKGAYACSSTPTQLTVDYPSSDPFVTSVGGTSLFLGADGTRTSESTWTGSGGGVSTIFARPAWQIGHVVPKNTKRTVADVAFLADINTGYYVFYQNQWLEGGGTSFGGPNWAALWSLTTEAVGHRAGIATPWLYLLSNIGFYPTLFHDITTGNNGNGVGPGFNAGPGWDYPTGLGSPNGANLVEIIRQIERRW
jgi:kumamolisin